MSARPIASLSLGFGLVSIPVQLFSAAEPSAGVRLHLLAPDGTRVRQQYVSEKSGKRVERREMVKGYEFEKDRYVVFTPDELHELDEHDDPAIDIVAFVPADAVDPLYVDKAWLLAPDKRGGKPYALLREAMRETGRCALARWTFRGKQSVVLVRPLDEGLVLHTLLYADEVRRPADLGIAPLAVSKAELQLARQLIDQISQDRYDPAQFHDEERQRIQAAIERKIAGRQVVEQAPHEERSGAQVIDLMDALRASLGPRGAKAAPASKAAAGPRPQARKARDSSSTGSRPTATMASEGKAASARRSSRAKL
ncbi:non-homologous end joining protein Ku [Rubrivivax gelatinosus]|uniref:non-homologous end joining protein Ku n=1 Tax=Rubrivivax gelatinosus TaxID=28068 RepID=UPI00031A2886|nr:Ku protein [Rubrivivax gelatinosus]MBG6079029.1 DNA end-binding protein Ku [Rubrivivax gelatinosus]